MDHCGAAKLVHQAVHFFGFLARPQFLRRLPFFFLQHVQRPARFNPSSSVRSLTHSLFFSCVFAVTGLCAIGEPFRAIVDIHAVDIIDFQQVPRIDLNMGSHLFH